MKKYVIFALAPLMLLFSCGISFHYMGDTLPPTTNVDIYYSSHNVKKPYTVFGKASDSGINIKKIQSRILEEAKKHGANGIIYSNMQSSNEVSNGNSDPSSIVINANFIEYK